VPGFQYFPIAIKYKEVDVYLSNRVGDWKAQHHEDFHQPNQICTNGQAMMRTDCLWDHLRNTISVKMDKLLDFD
jgi:hypothetical protein